MQCLYLLLTISFILFENTKIISSACVSDKTKIDYTCSIQPQTFGITDNIDKESNVINYYFIDSVDTCCEICLSLKPDCKLFLFGESVQMCFIYIGMEWSDITEFVTNNDYSIGYTVASSK
jgi:hypothetical protein